MIFRIAFLHWGQGFGLYPGPEAVGYFSEKLDEYGFKYSLGSILIPYNVVFPLDYWYCDGKPYFHCAKTGFKFDAVRKHDKVSYGVMDEGFRKEDDWALNVL